jgi:hypothetical protein
MTLSPVTSKRTGFSISPVAQRTRNTDPSTGLLFGSYRHGSIDATAISRSILSRNG